MKQFCRLFVVAALMVGVMSCGKDEEKSSSNDQPQGPEAVDMGLSVKWASYNLGAKTPEEAGGYFAWGEVASKSNFTWDNYRYGLYDRNATPDYGMTRYCVEDGIITLLKSDDAAFAIWGDSWRMPTVEEVEELLDTNNCIWSIVEENGTATGHKVVSKKTGKSIFLPRVGYYPAGDAHSGGAHYWTSNVVSDYVAYAQSMDMSGGELVGYLMNNDRASGLCIRPVKK